MIDTLQDWKTQKYQDMIGTILIFTTLLNLELKLCTNCVFGKPLSMTYSAIRNSGSLALAAAGEVEPRPGILDLFDAARGAGLKVGVCSAATKSSAICVLENLLGPDRFRVSHRWLPVPVTAATSLCVQSRPLL